ncbi:MAG TPA: cupin domain-containing protein [Candidatus Binataceae bacterium]|jgi:quercetin dioxygenase-like cupin family protein|nr:cupin domain-containing protein [Candidatus Binataceae bacterium]
MITRRQMMKAMGGSAAVAAQLFAALALAEAAEDSAMEGGKAPNPLAGDKGVTVRPIMQHDLPDVPGKQISVVVVEFAPGAGNSPHRHPGSTVAYVLEGSVVSQVDPDKPVTYHAGQTWYELPEHTHRVARNASKTRPAKILAVLISAKGQELVLPPD